MTTKKNVCNDCGGELRAIKINDSTHKWIDMQGAQHVEPTYSAVDATASWFAQRMPPEGVIKGRICTECGQITLYGEPKAN
ncbi:MAG: hypothetical protein R3C01_00380 [Planctomycetaceae bacterium]